MSYYDIDAVLTDAEVLISIRTSPQPKIGSI